MSHLHRATSTTALAASVWAVVFSGSAAAGFVAEEGAVCVLNKGISFDVTTDSGKMRIPLDEGSELAIVAVTPLSARVRSGGFEGRIELYVLDEACGEHVEPCTLKAAIKVQEKISGDGKQWRIKPGAPLKILSRGPTWSSVRFGPVEGYSESAALVEQCPVGDREPVARIAADELDDADDAPLPRSVPLPPLPKGTRILVFPFLTTGGAPSDTAALYEDALTSALKSARGDVSGPANERPSSRARNLSTKDLLKAIVKDAREKGLSHVVIGELHREVKKAKLSEDDEEIYADETDEERAARIPKPEVTDVLFVTVFDLSVGKVTKRLQLKPTLKAGDPWATRAAEALSSVLPAANAAQKGATQKGATQKDKVSPSSTTPSKKSPPTNATKPNGKKSGLRLDAQRERTAFGSRLQNATTADGNADVAVRPPHHAPLTSTTVRDMC